MRKINDSIFVTMQYDPDKIVGIRVYNGDLYFIAYMEDAVHYKIKQAMNSNGYLLDKTALLLDGDIFTCIENIEHYNHMYILYELDDEENLICEDDKDFLNAHDKFLSLLNYKWNKEEHEIFILTQKELAGLCDALHDGDYVFILTEERGE